MNGAELLEKREAALALFDVYAGFLTNEQKSVFQDYFSFDLSLSEIAKNRHISRAAVSDSLSKSLAKMEECEKNVGVLRRNKKIAVYCQKARQAASVEERLIIYEQLEEYLKHGL
jgi:predicted DNA-binding protein YlxM (UPF0122 family)